MEMEMFLTRKNQSRKQLLQTMDGELDMVEALGLCTATMKRPRKEQGVDQKKKFLVVEKWLLKLGRYCVQKTFVYKLSNVSVHSW